MSAIRKKLPSIVRKHCLDINLEVVEEESYRSRATHIVRTSVVPKTKHRFRLEVTIFSAERPGEPLDQFEVEIQDSDIFKSIQ